MAISSWPGVAVALPDGDWPAVQAAEQAAELVVFKEKLCHH